MHNFNSEAPKIMHIDLNSAFAMTEQQAHPSLRGRPVGVTNRISPECCVIAASYEAKRLGVKVGMRRSEAMAICPDFVLMETDPTKYTDVYRKLLAIMKTYSPRIKMKSIDEGIIDFHGTEGLLAGKSLVDVGYEIKQRVQREIGDWMTVNVGIAPNRFLAKQAAGWHKPDGLDVLDHRNLLAYYDEVELIDLSGIAERNQARLNACGIVTPRQFLDASELVLKKQVFRSIMGTYWHQRLRGYEIDDYETHLGMVGRQWVVQEPLKTMKHINSCLSYLCETTGMKLRYRQVEARGICVWGSYQNGEYWKNKRMHRGAFFTNQDIYRHALELFNQRPPGTLRVIGVYCYGLEPSSSAQLELFEDVVKHRWLTQSMDEINDRFGKFTIYSAETLEGQKRIKQKIPFGGTEYFELLLGSSK